MTLTPSFLAHDDQGAALLERHGAFLKRLARALTGDPNVAEDLAQATLVDATLQREAPGRPWLVSVLRRKAASRWRSEVRRGARERAYARPEAQPSAGDTVEHLDLVERLFAMVRELEEPQREAILARFYRGTSLAQIARDTGVPASTVQSRVQSGLATLRERLDRREKGGREAWLSALSGFAMPSKGASSTVAVGASTGIWVMGLAASVAAVLIVGAIWFQLGPGAGREGSDRPVANLPSMTDAQVAATLTPAGAGTDRMEVAGSLEFNAATDREPLLADSSDASFGRVLKINEDRQRVPAAGVEVHWVATQASEPPTSSAAGAPSSGLFYAEGTSAAATSSGDSTAVLALPMGAGSGTDKGTALTDEMGRFTLAEGVQAALVRLEIPSDETLRRVQWTPPEGGAGDSVPIVLLQVPHGVLEGRVVDLDARPMKGVTVEVRSVSGREGDAAVTDDAGHFALHATTTNPRIRAELAGHIVAGSKEPVALEEGGWAHQEIVMARTGVLEVDLGPGPERWAGALASYDQFHTAAGVVQLNEFSGQTDAKGVVRIEGLPIGQKLMVLTGHMDLIYAYHLGGQALAAPIDQSGPAHDGATPIVLPESGYLGLSIRNRYHGLFHGRVVDESGDPVPHAYVNAHMAFRDILGLRSIVGQSRTDEAGAFSLSVGGEGARGPFLLHTSIRRRGGPSIQAAMVVPPEQSGDAEIVLVAKEIRSLMVKVELAQEGDNEEDIQVQLALLEPMAVNEVRRPLSVHEQSGRSLGEGGEFKMVPPIDGRYMLRATHPRYTPVEIELLWPSDEPVLLRLEERLEAQLTVRVEFEDENAGPYGTVTAVPLAKGTPAAALQSNYSLHGGAINPERRIVPSGAQAATALPGGRRHESIVAKDQSAVTVGLSPGPVWVGASTRNPSGAGYARTATGAVEVPPGSSEITLTLRPTLAVAGRLTERGVDPRESLSLQVFHPGSKDPLAVGLGPMGISSPWIRTSRQGQFEFRVPSGSYRLEVGTEAELQAGRPRRIQSIAVPLTAPLEIALD